jgi:hypothetical protein
VKQSLQSPDCRVNQVGKKNGEQEKNQGSPRRVEKPESYGKQEGRKQDTRRA